MANRRPTLRELEERIARLEEEKQKLQAQVQQSQRMEAIGQLAGGVAHDFNNLLTVINGYTSLSLSQLDPEGQVHKDMCEVMKAGEKAAGLTQQLLSFSRKQLIQPMPLDLNHVVQESEKILRRVLGEQIQLRVDLSREPVRICADLGHVQQVIMNLAINSRDAMPGGGILRLETGRVFLDSAQVEWLNPGSYAVLVIGDTGTGMSEETKARIFEPFFTTKEPGKGTGLGLSTVYGIVRQAGGSIVVDSQLGKGTRMTIYLPALDAAVRSRRITDASRGTETILLAEDNPQVRRVTSTILERLGYNVLEAANAGEAILICEEHDGPIPLLITDVVMPGMPGPRLAQRLATLRPRLKAIFVSGHADHEGMPEKILGGTITFLQKPFEPEQLAATVRETLDKP